MQGKEQERGDPSGYAFGVKCSATVSGDTAMHEKDRRDDALIFGIGIIPLLKIPHKKSRVLSQIHCSLFTLLS